MAKSTTKQLNEDEMKIIAYLQRNSNDTVSTIARHCGYSQQKTTKIIKQLEKNHYIWGYSAVTDEEIGNLEKFMLLIKRSPKVAERKIVNTIALSQLQSKYEPLGISVISSYYLHGEYDWALIFSAQDIQRATSFQRILTENFPGIILQMNLMRILFSQREHYIFNPNPTKLEEFL